MLAGLFVQLIEVDRQVFSQLLTIESGSHHFPTELLPDGIRIDGVDSFYWIPQGASMTDASIGVSQLASELITFMITQPPQSWKVSLLH